MPDDRITPADLAKFDRDRQEFRDMIRGLTIADFEAIRDRCSRMVHGPSGIDQHVGMLAHTMLVEIVFPELVP